MGKMDKKTKLIKAVHDLELEKFLNFCDEHEKKYNISKRCKNCGKFIYINLSNEYPQEMYRDLCLFCLDLEVKKEQDRISRKDKFIKKCGD